MPHTGSTSARPDPPVGSSPSVGTDSILSWRVGLKPRTPGAGDGPLRRPTAWLPCLSLWTGSGGDVYVAGGFDPVGTWLSGPGSQEEPRGANPRPGAVSPLQPSSGSIACCLPLSVPPGGTSNSKSGRGRHDTFDRARVCGLVGG